MELAIELAREAAAEGEVSPTKVEVMARSEKFFPPEASFILLMT